MSAVSSLPQVMDTPKRPRKPNWTHPESVRLLEVYREKQPVLNRSFKDGVTFKKKQEAWLAITMELNESFPEANRTVKECQKRYQTLQMTAKPKIKKYNEAHSKTGKNIFHNVFSIQVLTHFLAWYIIVWT